MKVLFLTLVDFSSLEERNIYTDLLRKFYQEGHGVYVISPVERKKHVKTQFFKFDDRLNILKLKIGNIQKTNVIEKGVSTITLESIFISAVKKYYGDITFDLVLYSTPPITLQRTVNYVKKRDNAITYLMLKDIFPQNAVDMGMLTKHGVKGLLYKYFRKKEKKLYRDSDYIGCMSDANAEYIRKHNPEIDVQRVELCPNCIEPTKKRVLGSEEVESIRKKYNIPNNKKVLIYGGNLGRPQGADFIIECINKWEAIENIFVLIVGSGTEYEKIKETIDCNNIHHTKLYQYLPKEEYDILLQICDVGLIFLDYRFTIPNFPSRLLGYMDAELPVLAIVDQATDVGKVVEDGNFGWYCKSNDSEEVVNVLEQIQKMEDLHELGKNAKEYLLKHFDTNIAYSQIMKHGARLL